MAAENFDLHKNYLPGIYNYFVETFLRHLEVRTMPKPVAFYVFAGTGIFKRLSISSLKTRKIYFVTTFSQKFFSFLLTSS